MGKAGAQGTAAIRRGYALGLVGVIIFCLSLPGTRLAVPELGAELVTAGRAALAGLLSLFAYLLVGRRRLPGRRHWRDLGLVIGGVVIGFPGFTVSAMREVEASHGGVVLSLLPLMTAGTGALFAGERRPALLARGHRRHGRGARLHALPSGRVLAGRPHLALAGFRRRDRLCGGARMTAHMPALEAISWSLALALPVSLPLMVMLWPAEPAAAGLVAWGALGFVAAFLQFIGFFFWYGGLATGGIARVGQIQLLQVYFTSASARCCWASVGPVTWVAALLTVLCVWLGR
ncbi:MAG: DMT family transporter [Geminicoccaceae bacterium]